MISESRAPGAWDSSYHAPVLVDEIIELFEHSNTILDCTLGGGGHSAALLASGHEVIGIDRDPAAVSTARERLGEFEAQKRFRIILGNFREADQLLPESQKFDGILADLGVSSNQIDAESRGFSFREGVPLDMRMDASAEITARDLLNDSDEPELIRILREFADEPRARKLAKEIVRRRETRAFETSDDLVNAIRAALGKRSGPPDFARIFQGIRIAVNDELSALDEALPKLRERLNPGGVMAVISYHSGEDRIVKNLFRDWSRACVCPPTQLQCTCGGIAKGSLVMRKAVAASEDEIARNPRSRSARLRAWRSAA